MSHIARVWLLSALASSALFGQGFPLDVHNEANVDRSEELVRASIPLPERLGLRSLSHDVLRVRTAAGAVLPTQFRVLSRWGGPRHDATKPIKWIQACFVADLPASATTTFFVIFGQAPSTPLQIFEDPSRIIITTRSGSFFTLSKLRYSILENVLIDGVDLVPAPGGQLRLRDEAGRQLPVTLTETYIEERGPVTVVVRQKGSVGPLRFTARARFLANSREVKYDFRLENPGAYGVFNSMTPATLYMKDLVLDLPTAPSEGRVVAAGRELNVGGARYELAQEFHPNLPGTHYDRFRFFEHSGSTQVGMGGRSEGSIGILTAGGGISVAVDRFWENFPKAFSKQGNRFQVHLWPEGGAGPDYRGRYSTATGPEPVDQAAMSSYRFEGGRWKTHTLAFNFSNTAPTPAQVSGLAKRICKPLIGMSRAWWTKRTMAIPSLWTQRKGHTDLASVRWERMNAIIHDPNAADSINHTGKVSVREFMKRGGTWGNRLHYGWCEFGDLKWAEGASSLHYDWPLHAMLNFVRTGDYGFFDVGRDMVAHRRDYDTNHCTNPNEAWRGAQFYEKGEWHGSYRFGEVSHTWLHGMLLHYALTGDEGTYEASLETVDFLLRSNMSSWNGLWGSRRPGWALEGLVAAYAYLGLNSCLHEAAGIVLNYERLELAHGARGYVPNEGDGGRVKPWMVNIFFNAAAKYVAVSNDPRPVAFLMRMRNWMRDDMTVRATTVGSEVHLPGVAYLVDAQGNVSSQSLHKGWAMIESLTWSYLMTLDQRDAEVAMELWNSLILYHQSGVGRRVDPGDPQSYSDISMRLINFPNTETKTMGQVLHWGHAGLTLQRVLQQGW